MAQVDELRGALARLLPSVRADLERLVRIPSVSSDPSAADELRASAESVAAMLGAAGLVDVEVLQVVGGKPAVLGHRPGRCADHVALRPPRRTAARRPCAVGHRPRSSPSSATVGCLHVEPPTTRPASHCTARRCDALVTTCGSA
jgi:hypothetical protein